MLKNKQSLSFYSINTIDFIKKHTILLNLSSNVNIYIMLSKNQKKLISSMVQKKYRSQHNLFLAEGEKCVNDLLLAGYNANLIVHTDEWDFKFNKSSTTTLVEVTKEELAKVSLQPSPQNLLALFNQPRTSIKDDFENELIIILDGIQDPGNMGTIIRLADWFDIKNIVCSLDTVDWFNPKVVQSTMGAISRVSVHYRDLNIFIKEYKKKSKLKVFGTLLDGENIYSTNLPSKGAILLGNEGKGIREEIINLIDTRLTIPAFSNNVQSDSLNVATAASIVCSEFRRSKFQK